jgi:hypothetical protein
VLSGVGASVAYWVGRVRVLCGIGFVKVGHQWGRLATS